MPGFFGFFDDDKDDGSLTFSYFIEKFSGLDTKDQKDIIKYANAAALGAVFNRINKGLSGTESIGLIDDLYLVLQKYQQQSNTIRSPLWLKFYDVFDKLSAKLKDYNYKLTYFDIVALINLTDMLQLPLGARNRLMLQLDKDNLIDETFFDNLETYLSIEDMTSENVNKCIRLTLGIKDYTEKFMTKISPKLFADKTKIAKIILDLTTVVSVIKDLRKKNIIPEYYPYLASYAIDNSRNTTPLNKVVIKSLMIIDEMEAKPFIKEVIDGFQHKNNEDILNTFWYNLIGSSIVTRPLDTYLDIGQILEYLIPALVNVYSIKYADVFSFLEKHTVHLDVTKALLMSVLMNGTNPTKDELQIITKKYYKDFISYALSKNYMVNYDPEMYTEYVKLNQGKDLHNDPNFKKWVQEWYIPHSKLKDDDFFTFSEQEQACYLNEPEKFKVENTSLGTVSVDVLKYNIKNIDGREFAYIYKYKDKKGNSPEIQDIITRRKETIDVSLKFTNSEIIDYHSELRVLEAYKRYMEKQALFISSLSLYEYGIVFSHFTGMFQYSTNYIKNRGNVDKSLPIYSCLFELIIAVCLENGIDIGLGDLQDGMTLEAIFYTKLSGRKDSLDKTEIKDLALNISKKFMERYYIEFNKIFEKAPENEDDLVIYRGVKDIYWNNNIYIGEFLALNIQSTTFIPRIPGNPYDIIENYTDALTYKDTASCCLKRILLKKGCRSIYIQLMEAAKRPLSQVILPSYSKYIIKEVHAKLMIEELKNNNQSCNVQKDFIKTFDMELIQTPSYPSVEDVVSKFSSHFKSWMYDTNSHWIVKGGFGLKKVMEIRYSKKDVIKTDDIDISVLFTKNDEDEIKRYKDKLIKEFNDFAYSTGVPYLFSYIEPRYIGEKELKWICQFSYAGREWVDISLVYSPKKVEVDELVSKDVGLPVKTIVGYAKDYKEILREENIRGIDDRTYQKRNPKTGFLAMKGRKDIQRTKELCFIEEVEKEFPTLCSYLKLSSVRVFMNLPEKELKALLK